MFSFQCHWQDDKKDDRPVQSPNQQSPTWSTSLKELRNHKQIARQLHTQYVDGINSNPVTLKCRLRSLKSLEI